MARLEAVAQKVDLNIGSKVVGFLNKVQRFDDYMDPDLTPKKQRSLIKRFNFRRGVNKAEMAVGTTSVVGGPLYWMIESGTLSIDSPHWNFDSSSLSLNSPLEIGLAVLITGGALIGHAGRNFSRDKGNNLSSRETEGLTDDKLAERIIIARGKGKRAQRMAARLRNEYTDLNHGVDAVVTALGAGLNLLDETDRAVSTGVLTRVIRGKDAAPVVDAVDPHAEDAADAGHGHDDHGAH